MRFLVSLGMTKRVSSQAPERCVAISLLTTKEKPSLRATEGCVAIPLFAIRICLNAPPRFTRGNNFVVGLKFMTDPKKFSKKPLTKFLFFIYYTCPVALPEGKHPFPFRTRKLSPLRPMVLSSQGDGRVGRCRAFYLHI